MDRTNRISTLKGGRNVRFGSLADICSAKGHVRFAPNSDRESGFPQTVMSALTPKADMCGATGDDRHGQKRTSFRTMASSHRNLRPLAFGLNC
jgi:hypothetical protein